jgi:translation initiation factor IF-2
MSLQRMETQIYGHRDPIVASYKIESGTIYIGMVLKTLDGKSLGRIKKILAGTILSDHEYVKTASEGQTVGLMIDSYVENMDLHLIF